jgi:hypothetical protein
VKNTRAAEVKATENLERRRADMASLYDILHTILTG